MTADRDGLQLARVSKFTGWLVGYVDGWMDQDEIIGTQLVQVSVMGPMRARKDDDDVSERVLLTYC